MGLSVCTNPFYTDMLFQRAEACELKPSEDVVTLVVLVSDP